MYSRIPVIAGVAAAALALVLTGCGSGGDDSQQTQTSAQSTHEAGASDAEPGCTPAVMVVRHAEDKANPKGGPDVLSDVGTTHADLYPKLFRDYLAAPHSVGPSGADVSVCPIGKIIAINKDSNPENKYPGANPYNTIEPLKTDLGLTTIQVKDGAGVSYSTVYNWGDTGKGGAPVTTGPVRRKALLDNGSSTPTSTVVAWDKQGLNPSAEDLSKKTITSDKYPNGATLKTYGYVPLLRALPANAAAIVGTGAYFDPLRTDFYVFTLQDPGSGKFAYAKAYRQLFSDDGGSTWSPTPTKNSNDIKLVKR